MIRSLLRNFHKPIYERPQEELVRLISSQLRPGDTVLDICCGFGQLGRALMDATPGIYMEGVESVRRGAELIPVTAYEGTRMPWPGEDLRCRRFIRMTQSRWRLFADWHAGGAIAAAGRAVGWNRGVGAVRWDRCSGGATGCG
ncbi:MAG: hypothetical protein LAP61_27215 [Acidobacteriia bacterium]|nr:hypothetical protein [Terriglobia bacterium]